jgi:PhnB protein
MASTTKPNPIPDSYRSVTPCLIVQCRDKALEFYAEVFAATERMRWPPSRLPCFATHLEDGGIS